MHFQTNSHGQPCNVTRSDWWRPWDICALLPSHHKYLWCTGTATSSTNIWYLVEVGFKALPCISSQIFLMHWHLFLNISSHKYQIFERVKHKHCTNIGDAVLRTVSNSYFAFHWFVLCNRVSFAALLNRYGTEINIVWYVHHLVSMAWLVSWLHGTHLECLLWREP